MASAPAPRRIGALPLSTSKVEMRPLVDAEPGAGIALRIEVDDQHPLADGRERRAEIDRRRGLADAALLIGEREDARAARSKRVHRAFAFTRLARWRDLDDMRIRRGQARMQATGEVPVALARPRSRLRRRGPSRTAPWSPPEERRRQLEQTRQRRQRPRAHDVRLEACSALRRALQCACSGSPQAPMSRARPRRGTRISWLLSTRCMRKSRDPGLEDGNDKPGKSCP